MARSKQEKSGPARSRSRSDGFALRNWDTARAFLEVVRRGSFRSGAQALHESVNTVRRQIEDLERDVGATLITRHVDGVRVTAEGARLLEAAKRMEAASFDLVRVRDREASLSGEVRISVTEGLGTFWLMPHLAARGRLHPKLLIEVNCEMRPADVLRLESDVGVQLSRPTAPDLRAIQLGTMHTMPFAARCYLEAHGAPKTLTEFAAHRIVLQQADQVDSARRFAELFPQLKQSEAVSIRTNVSSAHYMAVTCGAGIGILPTYAVILTDAIVPVDIEGVRFAFEIWLAYHPDTARIPRVRRTIDWLVEVFSPKVYPWFAKDFVHPRDLPGGAAGLSLSSLFEGLEPER